MNFVLIRAGRARYIILACGKHYAIDYEHAVTASHESHDLKAPIVPWIHVRVHSYTGASQLTQLSRGTTQKNMDLFQFSSTVYAKHLIFRIYPLHKYVEWKIIHAYMYISMC